MKSFSKFIAVTACATLLLSPVAAQSVLELRNQAKSAFRAGDYDKAVALYQDLVKTNPDREAILKEAMWAFWNMNRVAEAESMARSIKAILPDDVEADKILSWAPAAANRKKIGDLHTQAKAAYQSGEYDRAAQLFRDITALDPNNITMLRDRMWILWNMKRIGEANEIASKILRLRPGDRDAQSILSRAPDARVRTATPASREVVLDLQARVEANPEDPVLQRQLAAALASSGRAGEAIARLKTYLESNPESAELWHQLGKIYLDRGNDSDATEAFMRSLEIDPNQPQLLASMGKRTFGKRNLDDSVRYFERAVSLGSMESKELLPILGKSLFYRGEFRRSAEVWGQAVDAFPDRSDYRFHEAEAIFYAGDQGLALAKMRQLRYEHREPLAIAFLVDNAVARNDFTASAVLLAEDLDKLSIEKGRKVIRLANIYVKLNRFDSAITLLTRWTNYLPRDVWALLTLASIQRDAARFADAIQTYERVLKLNPRSRDAHLGMADAYFSLGNDEDALDYMAQALSFEPTNPYMLRDYANALFSSGQRRRGRELLLEWIEKNANLSVMPILLYHGISPFDDAPMLGYEIHTTITSFESQMRSLREADYQAISMKDLADWHAGKEISAIKPVFIMFDDARMDSFRYADPILDQYGLRATMMVPLDDVESYGSIGYANWNIMKEYQKTGRWDFDSHGGRAHSRIAVDARGRKMLYLVMPQWLPDQGRSETEEEWKERIDKDHVTIKAKLAEQLNTDAIGYAWPEGSYGEHSDSATAIENNLELVKKHFQFAFVQDQYGLNVPTQDPYFMHRIEPPKEWSGKELVAHFTNKSPHALIYQELLHMAVEEKKFSEANNWLKKLKELGVSENIYLAEKARINYASGRSSKAYQLALQSFTSEPTVEVQKMLTDFKSRSGIVWRPSTSFQHDNNSRENISFEQEFEIPMLLQLRGLLLHGRSKFREREIETVYETRLGVGAEATWADGHTMQAKLIRHSLSTPAKSVLGYSATYWARWKDNFQTRIEAKRGFHNGARAMLSNVRKNDYRATAHFGETPEWGLRARGRYMDFSDQNSRKSGEVEAGWKNGRREFTWGPVYRFSFDNTKSISPNYYSPRDLYIHSFGPQFVFANESNLKFVFRYFPGYSKESLQPGINKRNRVTQLVDASLSWSITPNVSFVPSFVYEESGNYYYNLSSVEFDVRF